MSDHFVFDTNVIVSAALFRHSISRTALDTALVYGRLLMSETTALELTTVLLRPKFDRYLQRDVREAFLTLFLQQTLLIEISETITACRDPKDDKFLEVAIDGKATLIVSGDRDLLDVQSYRGIAILSPRLFLDHYTQ